jgi:signal transduction histidine kinase
MSALADYMCHERDAVVLEWRRSIQRDPELTEGDALPRVELIDHIPEVLAAFERRLRQSIERPADGLAEHKTAAAAAHGLQRWKQGYDLREVTRELGKLNECVMSALDRFAKATAGFSLEALSRAHQIWAKVCTSGIEESVSQYFSLQQREAAGHVTDLESALAQLQEIERQRGEAWQQAAHDLRGNLSVVANATVGLTRHARSETTHEDFLRILMHNVTSLHHLLNDVTSLARLQAGYEKRQVDPLDVTVLIRSLCDGIRPLAVQRGLYLRCDGPPGLAAEGDAVKVRRIAQNLILNAVKYTREGGITVSWGEGDAGDSRRWVLSVADTGPGFHTDSGRPMADLLDFEHAARPRSGAGEGAKVAAGLLETPLGSEGDPSSLVGEPGEGIGLSIVKRLCELLDATIEMESVPDRGTAFRVFFPRQYVS